MDDTSQLEGYVWMPKMVILINEHVVRYGERYVKKAIAKEGKFKARLGGIMKMNKKNSKQYEDKFMQSCGAQLLSDICPIFEWVFSINITYFSK